MEVDAQDAEEYRYWSQFLRKSQRIVLLQGPIGPFFAHLNTMLSDRGKSVYKINFNGGDEYYYPPHFQANDPQQRGIHSSAQVNRFTGSISEFSNYLTDFIQTHAIDAVVCFGDQRPYHQIARQVCQTQGCSFWVFEEGYLRPHYITFEAEGVNFNSTVNRSPEFYQSQHHLGAIEMYHHFTPERVASGFWRPAWLAMHYYLAMWFNNAAFPHYQHHRHRSPIHYLMAWCRAGFVKVYYSMRDLKLKKQIESGAFPDFFIFPLQVHNDSQIRFHGKQRTIAQYLRLVIRSFALSAPASTHLVIKHHPMDRGFSHYGRFIRQLTKRYHLEGRIHYCFEIPMPILLRNAKGMVVINSTTGISALIHTLPVKVLGDAHYDIPGITSPQSLAEFWRKPMFPDEAMIDAYLAEIWLRTQINRSFYQ